MATKIPSLAIRRLSALSKLNLPSSSRLLSKPVTVLQCDPPNKLSLARFTTSSRLFGNEEDEANKTEEFIEEFEEDIKDNWMARYTGDPKDRSRKIPLEVSMAYMESEAYKRTYGDHKVWELYRRNFKDGKMWAEVRKTCIRRDYIATGNPCPICRDEYLVVDHRNLKLIEQFIEPYSKSIYSSRKTGVCKRQYKNILIAIDKARNLGILTVDQPFVSYDYSKYNR